MRRGLKPSGGVFDVSRKSLRLDEISSLETQPGFWESPEKAKVIQKEKNGIESVMDQVAKLQSLQDDLGVLLEFIESDPSEENLKEANANYQSLCELLRAAQRRRAATAAAPGAGS